MLEYKLKEVLKELSDDYITAASLAQKLQISERTVRTRIKQIQELEAEIGCKIISSPRWGYRVTVCDRMKFEKELQRMEKGTEQIPQNLEERVRYLLLYLINQEAYIKMDDLCEFLCCSRSSLSYSLKRIKTILSEYGISIKSRPNYGICISGMEFDIRRFIGEYFFKQGTESKDERIKNEKELRELAGIILENIEKQELILNETEFNTFLNQVYIAKRRIRRGYCIADGEIEEQKPGSGSKEWDVIVGLTDYFQQKENLVFSENEQKYLWIYFLGKRMSGYMKYGENNVVIYERIDRIVMELLEIILEEFQIDFRNDFDIRMALNQHMMAFEIRMKYKIPLKNPMLEEIKGNYALAYRMIMQTKWLLEKTYQTSVSSDELGYFALIFAFGMEQQDKKINKKSILVVCATGKSSSKLLLSKYKNEFGKYLENTYTCDLLSLKKFDFSKVDYVFTTVPIRINIPVPIIETGNFLEYSDILRIRTLLEKGDKRFLDKYFCKEHFIAGLEAQTREEALTKLCSIILEKEQVEENLYELVMEREHMAPTDFGNNIAVPHPREAVAESTFAYVAVLKKPIFWGHNDVQVILMNVTGKNDEEDLQKFHEISAKFVLNREGIQQVIENPSYEIFENVIKNEFLPD
ncbi:MAG: BglG family transcription antiterminator [Lachnospiraceae bacterium]|nr:BglG family transcription antiterminator [Lachnospiraceae bacterium]